MDIDAQVLSTRELLSSLNVEDVKGLDLRGMSSVTDYYLIATVNSYGQLKGVVRQLHEHFYTEGIDCRGGKKQNSEDNWTLLDCHHFFVHLMTREARQFYDIEKLWFEAPAF